MDAVCKVLYGKKWPNPCLQSLAWPTLLLAQQNPVPAKLLALLVIAIASNCYCCEMSWVGSSFSQGLCCMGISPSLQPLWVMQQGKERQMEKGVLQGIFLGFTCSTRLISIMRGTFLVGGGGEWARESLSRVFIIVDDSCPTKCHLVHYIKCPLLLYFLFLIHSSSPSTLLNVHDLLVTVMGLKWVS